MNRDGLKARIETLEKAYEFFLSYAALGATSEEATKVGGQLRSHLGQANDALLALENGLPALLLEGTEEGRAQPAAAAYTDEQAAAYRELIDVTTEDAAKAGAVVRAVLAQETIDSQLVDNLNASTHLRALLTDLFLLDDIV